MDKNNGNVSQMDDTATLTILVARKRNQRIFVISFFVFGLSMLVVLAVAGLRPFIIALSDEDAYLGIQVVTAVIGLIGFMVGLIAATRHPGITPAENARIAAVKDRLELSQK